MRPWLACIPLIAAVATAQREIPPDSVERLIDVWHLPQLLPGVTCKQFASTDPSVVSSAFLALGPMPLIESSSEAKRRL